MLVSPDSLPGSGDSFYRFMESCTTNESPARITLQRMDVLPLLPTTHRHHREPGPSAHLRHKASATGAGTMSVRRVSHARASRISPPPPRSAMGGSWRCLARRIRDPVPDHCRVWCSPSRPEPATIGHRRRHRESRRARRRRPLHRGQGRRTVRKSSSLPCCPGNCRSSGSDRSTSCHCRSSR